MIKRMTIGRYYQTDSILHRLDPRVKIVMGMLYLIAVFLTTSPPGLAGALIVVLFLFLLSRIPLWIMLSSLRPVLFLLLFIFLLNALTWRAGEPLVSFWRIYITDEGLLKAFLMSLRLLLLVASTSLLLTLTTTPLLLSDALESLFSPLKKLRFPVHEMAMMMSIAIRFVPTLAEETDKIMKAQASRGAKYDTGNIMVRIKGYVTVLVPLFVSAFKRAEDLATAMDARCYRGGQGRTKLRVLSLGASDVIWLFLLIGLAAAIVLVDFLYKIG